MLLEDGEANPLVSRPSRGAWIETGRCHATAVVRSSRALHGARGLKRGEQKALRGRRRVAPFTGRVD